MIVWARYCIIRTSLKKCRGPRRVERLSRISYDFLYYNDSIVSATSAYASLQQMVSDGAAADRSGRTASDCSSPPAIAADATQYLAESPFSCQTSIVPVTRNQFYLVVQINMNNGGGGADDESDNDDDKDQAKREKGEGEGAESEAVLEREKTEESGVVEGEEGEGDRGSCGGKTGFAQLPVSRSSLSLLPLSFSASASSVSSLLLPPPPPPLRLGNH